MAKRIWTWGSLTLGLMVATVAVADIPIEQLPPTELTAPQRVRDSNFGDAVAISADGRVILVGASREGDRRGAAYLFEPGDGGRRATRLAPSSPVGGFQEFGDAVALSGDGSVALVGSPYDDQAGRWSGAVYMYTRHGTSWGAQKMRPRRLRAGDYFGAAIDISNDGSVWVAGASKRNAGGQDVGVVFVYTREARGWRERILRHPNPNPNDGFGHSLSLSGDGQWLAVGAHTAGPEGRFRGQVYLFRNAPRGFQLVRRIQPEGLTESAIFGAGVALSEDGGVLIATAPQQQPASLAYVYRNANRESALTPPTVVQAPGGRRFGALAMPDDASYFVAGTLRFHASRDQWVPRHRLQVPTGASGGDLGCSAAAADNGHVLGACTSEWFGAALLYRD